ncbi:MAG: hypothetical protein A2542_01175 [Parcubacteria group bacterium RIFOXYD2_FULL_52_8]|nr:MAG: hypothetical protein A2542_01175 [Parcubacteria group bacterium RIFOXYD2_FULL_52_8]
MDSKVVVPEVVTNLERASEEGFLVYRASEEEIRKALADSKQHIIKVSEHDDVVTGYFFAYDVKEWQRKKPEWRDSITISQENASLLNARILYGRHIAVDTKYAGQGTGTTLLEAVGEEGGNRGYEYFVDEVLEKPLLNKRSTKLMERNQFSVAGTSKDSLGRIWKLWCKRLV